MEISSTLKDYLLSSWDSSSPVCSRMSFDSSTTVISSSTIDSNLGRLEKKAQPASALSDLIASSVLAEDLDSMLALEQMSLRDLETKEGSVEFQRLTGLLNAKDLAKVFRRWTVELVDLSFANFANYAVLAIVKRLESYERRIFLAKIQTFIVKMAIHSKASMILQEVIKQADETNAAFIFKAMEDKLFKLAKNAYSCYCLQYLVTRLDREMRNRLFSSLFTNIDKLAQHKKASFIVDETCNHEVEVTTARIGLKVLLENSELIKNSINDQLLKKLITHLKSYANENVQKLHP